MKRLIAIGVLSLIAAAAASAQPRNVRMGLSATGALVFQRSCAACHLEAGATSVDPRAPRLETLRQYPPERILDALSGGKMKVQGAALSEADRREVAEWLSARALGAATAGDAATMPNRCAPAGLLAAGPAWNGWSVDARNARFQAPAAAGLSAADLPRLKLKWAFGLPGGVQVFSQPTVYGGRLFLGSDSGQVYALDARTGCVHWSYLAEGAVRTAPLVVERGRGAAPLLVFGDLKARLYALDAATGRPAWSAQVDEQPLARITGAPTYHAGRLYVPVASSEEGSARLPAYECCRHRGSVVAVDAATGRQLWKTYMMAPATPRTDASGRRRWGPAGAGVWASPTVDAKRERLYVTTGDAYAAPAGRLTDAVVALDLKTGKLVWAHQDTADDVWVAGCSPGVTEGCPEKVGPDWDFGSSAMLQTLADGRDLVVAAHKGGVAVALDPDRGGAVVWRRALSANPPKYGGAEVLYGGAADRSRAYFALGDAAQIVALDLATGRQVWSTPIATPAERAAHKGAGAAVSGLPGALFAGGWDGILRAVAVDDGGPLWSYDTARDFETVNRVAARGGSMGAPGATVAGGMVFVGSGYVGVSNGMPGNALLAFAP